MGVLEKSIRLLSRVTFETESRKEGKGDQEEGRGREKKTAEQGRRGNPIFTPTLLGFIQGPY